MRPQLPDGYTVEFTHARYDKMGARADITPGRGREYQPKGGSTVAHIYNSDGEEILVTEARCSDKDNYNKKIGRDIALGRAIAILTGKMTASVPNIKHRGGSRGRTSSG